MLRVYRRSSRRAAVNLDWLWAALIGVGGWYVLKADQQRDREDSRTDRSRQSAMAIAEAAGNWR